MKHRTFEFRELRVIGKKIKGILPYYSKSRDLGGFKEVLLPGCFSESIKSGERVVSLFNHDSSKPLGSTDNGTLKLSDKRDGLHFEINPPSTTYAKDVFALVNSGTVPGASFGFSVGKENWKNGGNLREIASAVLHEISVGVTFPAYPKTQVCVRGIKTMNTTELREQRAKLHNDMKELNDNLRSADDRVKYGQMDAEYERLSDLIDNKEGDEERALKLAERDEYLSRSQHKPIKPDPSLEYRGSRDQASHDPKYAIRASKEYRNDFENVLIRGDKFLSAEKRALMVDDDSQAGFLVVPEKFLNEVIKGVDDETYALSKCRVIPCPDAQSLGIPALHTDPDDADWTGEIIQAVSDNSMDVDKRVLHPHPLSKEEKVSKPLARISTLAVPLVRDRLSYKFGVTIEKGWISGTGVNCPLGMMTVSDLGISTDRDVSTGNTQTALKADNLIEVSFSLKSQYLKNAEWVFHRDSMKAIRKLKDGEGHYLFESSLQKGTPNMLLGLPVNLSEYMSNTFSAGLYLGILGDFKRGYYWAMRMRMEIQVLVELYAATNQNGYIGRMELDGMPVLEEAFTRVQLAA